MAQFEIEDMYKLSPMQEGMLFHSLRNPDSQPYVVQCYCIFQGKIDANVLLRCWRQVINRHSILRTLFLFEGLNDPMQIVAQELELSFTELDWQDLSGARQEEQWGELALADRKKGFDLTQPP